MSRRPDVVILVADCLREDELEREVHESRFLGELRRQVVAFSNCSSVSNWTIPAHATLLTGLYPFEHNVHRLGLRSIPVGLPTTATLLSQMGYATQFVSANHILRPTAGFTQGFDYAAWGMWGETSLRITSASHPPFDSSGGGGNNSLRENILSEEPAGIWRAGSRAAEIMRRFPWFLDGISRTYAAVFGAGEGPRYRVAPWVERTMERFLASVPAARPTLSVLNLMDCHEPYLPEPGQIDVASGRLHLATSRQDRSSWTGGRWRPTQKQFRELRELYEEKVHVLGMRVERIVEILKASGRWENTLFILTGDHGQAFGEHGQLFHGGELFEAVTHVPLWVRFPHGDRGGRTALARTSLVDVHPTVLDAVEPGLANSSSGVPLGQLIDSPRLGPTFSVADGFSTFGTSRFPLAAQPGSAQVAIYSGRLKLMVDYSSGRTRAFQLDEDPSEMYDVWGANSGILTAPRVLARQMAEKMSPASSLAGATGVVRRLHSWGYLD